MLGGNGVAVLKRRYGAHLSDAARKTLDSRRPYPPLATFRNPLTRQLVRRLADSDWEATREQLDFDYSLTDESIAGVPCVRMQASTVREGAPLVLFIHGGAFCAGGARANAAAVLPTLNMTGSIAIGIDYAKAPERVFPAALEEIESVYRALLSQGANPSRMIVCGESAGGNLAVASMMAWREKRLPSPKACILYSPTLDARFAFDTAHTQHRFDPFVKHFAQREFSDMYELYAPGMDKSDPRISPAMGNPAGLPPLLIQVGTREVLLGDSARFAGAAADAGVDATLRVFDGMFHLFHMHWRLPEAKKAQANAAAFIRRHAG